MAAPAASDAPARRSRSAAPGRATPQPEHPSPPEPGQQPRLRVVAAPRRARRWLAALVVTGLVGVTGITSISAAGAEAAFQARELNDQISQLEETRNELSTDVAELSSLRRIREIATERLGMVPAEDARYVRTDAVHRVPASHRPEQPGDPLTAPPGDQW